MKTSAFIVSTLKLTLFAQYCTGIFTKIQTFAPPVQLERGLMDAHLFLKSQLWLQTSASDAWPPEGAPNLTLESSLASFALKPAAGAPIRDDWLILRSLGRKRRRDNIAAQNEASESVTLDFEVAIAADQDNSCTRLYFRIDRTVYFVDHTLIESIACPVPAADGAAETTAAPVVILAFPNVIMRWLPQIATRKEAVLKLHTAVCAMSAALVPTCSYPDTAATDTALSSAAISGLVRARKQHWDTFVSSAFAAAQPEAASTDLLRALPRPATLALALGQGSSVAALLNGAWHGVTQSDALNSAAAAFAAAAGCSSDSESSSSSSSASAAASAAQSSTWCDAQLAQTEAQLETQLEELIASTWRGGSSGSAAAGDAAAQIDQMTEQLLRVKEERL
eukprot:7389-Heterococcus_DN1.PRE.1